MAEVVEKMPAHLKDYLDGRVWKLSTEDLGRCASFKHRRNSLYVAAKRLGLRASVRFIDGFLYVQAFPKRRPC